jgi:hypothetical protein
VLERVAGRKATPCSQELCHVVNLKWREMFYEDVLNSEFD